MVHFQRNVLAKVPRRKRKTAAELKAVFAMEDRDKTLSKAESVAVELDWMKLGEAASCLCEGIGEATTYQLPEFPMEHWRLIRTNNMIERLNLEIRRRTRIVGQFPDGRSALILVTARIRHVTQKWPKRRYQDMSLLEPIIKDTVETPRQGNQG